MRNNLRISKTFFDFPRRYGGIFALQSSSSLVAVAISTLAAPVLTRIYSPSEYAVYAAYLLVINLVAPIAMLRYETAIILPSQRVQAVSVAMLCVLSVITISSLIALVLFVSPATLPRAVGEASLRPWQLLIPLGLVVGALILLTQALALREGAFKVLALSRIIGAAMTSTIAISSGVMGFGPGSLIVAQIIGGICAVVVIAPGLHRFRRAIVPSSRIRKIAWTANRYRRFPLISVPSDLMGSVGTQGHVLAISVIFGSTALGAVALGQRIVGAGSSILGKAIGDVFRREAARQWAQTRNFQSFFVATLLWMTALAAVIYLPLLIFGPKIFHFVFGAQWRIAGEYAAALAPFFAMQFVVGNLAYTTYITERQDVDIYIQGGFLVALGVSILAAIYTHSVHAFLSTLSFSLCLIYSVYLYVCWRLSGGRGPTLSSRRSS